MNNQNHKDDLLNLNEKDKIIGEIYIITNKKNNFKYVGQTVTHRKNKGKYRPFGYIGRFNDHISEAINNTKKKQCTYLNNAIRKYGKELFSVELIDQCSIENLDNMEQFWIKVYKTLCPDGYNLTKGGKTISSIKTPPKILNKTKKRGREFGYKHNQSTKNKMSMRLKNICNDNKIKNRMRNTMKEYYDKQKIEILKQYKLDDNIEIYIKPVCHKTTKLIHDYIIKINGRKLTLSSTDETLQQKYDRLRNILIKAKTQTQT